CSRGGDVDYW
nr:immunoglobulin heavy chain junction region [Mus musculus]MBK4183884.1 immunoglobulin heavy chain junction region [Mus musculus]